MREPEASLQVDAPRARSAWDRLCARRGARFALFGLWLLCGMAVLAPLLANDRPLFVRMVDRDEIERARSLLVPLAASVAGLWERTDEAYAADRLQGSTLTRSQAIAREETLLLRCVDVLERVLENEGPLSNRMLVLRRSLEERSPGSLRGVAVAVDRELVPVLAGRSTSDLASRSCSPALAALDAGSVAAIALWVGVLALVALRAATSRAQPRSAVRLAVGLASCVVLIAATWYFVRPTDEHLDSRPWKERLASPTAHVELVVFAPIAMGFAETHSDETWRPPTWLASSRIDEQGRYIDPERGEGANAPLALVVRPGEPERNSAFRHLLGTDGSGRDIAARLLWGARASLAIGFGAALLLALVGTLAGGVSGYFGGLVDLALSRVLEVVLCFPAFFLVLALAALADPTVVPPTLCVLLVIAGVGWTTVARLVRADCLKLRRAEFVLAAQAQGFSRSRVLFVHVLPNALAPALVALSLGVGSAILTEAGLSFLGLGVAEPVPSWGTLAADARNAHHWWVLVFPGLCVFASSWCANVVGEALRDVLDPRTIDGARERVLEELSRG